LGKIVPNQLNIITKIWPSMTEEQLKAEIEEHSKVYDRVTKEVEYWQKINEEDIRTRAHIAPHSRGIHGIFLLYKIDLQTFLQHEIGKIEPYDFYLIYKGRKAIRVFIDIINMFEGQLNHIAEVSQSFQEKINGKIDSLINSVEENWRADEKKIKDGITKKDVLKIIESKKHETSMRRRALLNLGWINKDEFDLLEFAWWLRNCMHNDFSALSDKNFAFYDEETDETYHIEFLRGQILGLHTRIVYGLSRIIGRILYNIVINGYKTENTTT